VELVQEWRDNGRRVGESVVDARVIRYSDADNGQDLALLEIRRRNFAPITTNVTFASDEIPSLGTELYHVGSLLGQFGSNSLTKGSYSQIGRVLPLGANGIVFDQVAVGAFPGSSGGGVFIQKTGEYTGMLVRGASEGFNLIVPVRRLREWAKTANVEWAIDPSIPVPAVRGEVIEDTGAVFGSSSKGLKAYPFLLYTPE
jgi:hypothetical protein